MENIKTSSDSRKEPVTKDQPLVTRRKIVARCLQLLATGGLFSIVWKFIRGTPPADIVVVFNRKLKKGEVIHNQGAYLVGSKLGAKAFSGRCPHLGCQLTYFPQVSRFQCPCHGSRFSIEGRRLEGPARKNMSELELRVDKKCGTYTARIPIN